MGALLKKNPVMANKMFCPGRILVMVYSPRGVWRRPRVCQSNWYLVFRPGISSTRNFKVFEVRQMQ